MKYFLVIIFLISSFTIAQNAKWSNYPYTKKIMTVKQEGNYIWVEPKAVCLILI